MPKAPSTIISHWNQLFENFNYSTNDYYQKIEEALQQRQIPDIQVSCVNWPEGGIFSAKRQYLRVRRERLVFDICGAPFGTGYFVSWWLGSLRKANIFVVIATLIVLFILGSIGLSLLQVVVTGGLSELMEYANRRRAINPEEGLSQALLLLSVPGLVWLVGFPLMLFLIFLFIRANPMGIEDTIIEIPYIGHLYERMFRPTTYYKIDTAMMFQSAVHAAVMQAIDEITAANGLKALSPEQRKPVMKEFYSR